MSENNQSYIIQIFTFLAVWLCLPPILFVLGIVSKTAAYIIFAALALPVIMYCLLPRFKDERVFDAEVNQSPEFPKPNIMELKSADSEIETVVLSGKRR